MSLHKHHTFLYISLPSLNDYNLKMSNFLLCGDREQKATTCFFFPWILLEFNFSKNCQHLTNWTRWNKRYKVWGSVTLLFKWRFRSRRHRCCLRFPRGGEVLKKCLYKEARPDVQPVTPVYTIFHEKRYPFCIPSIEKWYPFHIPLLEFCMPLTAVNALSFKGTVSRQSGSFCLILPITRPQSQWNLK